MKGFRGMFGSEGGFPYYGTAVGFTCGLCVGWLLFSRRGRLLRRLASSRELAPIEETFSEWPAGKYKLVLVVRNDLRMGKGKVAAQCSHASVIAARQADANAPDLASLWAESGQQKVVVKIEDEESMLELANEAQSRGLLTSIVSDAGRTQVQPGTRTVLGIGPGPEELIDEVTGHLKLL